MRVFILGLDALDYYLVEKFDLRSLKQVEYGKSDVGDLVLITPVVWASFITGLMPSEHGVTASRSWNWGLLERAKELGIALGLYRIKGKGRFLELLMDLVGINVKVHDKSGFESRRVSTIFDFADRPIAINVPTYNEEPVVHENKRLFLESIGNGDLVGELEDSVWEVYQKRRDLCFRLIDGPWDLFMVYFHGVTDLLGHLYRAKLAKMWEIYAEMDSFVQELRERIGDDALLMIVSDHGMKVLGGFGDHTNYGFYSLNQKLCLDHPKICDFAGIIRQKLGE
ncbi:MAG: alkaline phosphatase family protein [Candidatus Bathyarchaeia archaeon]